MVKVLRFPLLVTVFYAKITVKREMKSIARFLLVLTCVAPYCAANAVVSQTAGSNLTAYNGESGATNNNRWNNLTNARSISAGSNATADFGNCNAVIMRCAQPKCGNGGCTDLSVTSGIVSGCVQSNNSCKQYGDELVQYIAAQLVASSTAKANAAANAAQTAAANAAAQQNAQQMAQMQQQMQQMQSQMAQQNAAQMAQLQSALDEQKQLTANAIAEATAAREAAAPVSVSQASVSSANGLSNAQLSAAQSGVSADILAREQISGQIMSAIENAETQLKTLKATMTDTFNYAGCDSRGNNCTGPKRVKTFKQKAEGFFDPYETVLDELYDALILAQSVGVDITDIYMMLNGSCNVWGQYLCSTQKRQETQIDKCTKDKDGKQECTYKVVEVDGWPRYTEFNCSTQNGKSYGSGVRGGYPCVYGQVIPPEDDPTCTLNKTIVDNKDDPVQRDWLWGEQGDMNSNIRVGCASSALESSVLFRNRKKQASIDIEALQKIIAQDAPVTISKHRNGKDVDATTERIKYCAVGSERYSDLQKWVATKGLPKNVCMSESAALRQINGDGMLSASGEMVLKRVAASEAHTACNPNNEIEDCKAIDARYVDWTKPFTHNSGEKCCAPAEAILCHQGGGTWAGSKCNCGDKQTFQSDYLKCMSNADYCVAKQTMPKGDNGCYEDCKAYCTDGGKSDFCYKSDTDKSLTKGKTCISSWDKDKCTCKEQ